EPAVVGVPEKDAILEGGQPARGDPEGGLVAIAAEKASVRPGRQENRLGMAAGPDRAVDPEAARPAAQRLQRLPQEDRPVRRAVVDVPRCTLSSEAEVGEGSVVVVRQGLRVELRLELLPVPD